MRFYFLIALLCTGMLGQAQTVLNWSDLSGGVTFQALSLEDNLPGFSKARFSDKIFELQGKEVILTGYFLVLDGSQSIFMLSKNPMASCFFCGNGGPETVAGLHFEEKPSFKMDDLLSVKGILRLNSGNPNQYYYRIENASAIRL